ncbi:MAG: rod-binding protein [Candidatus Omnitrophica bacterium]|nr:rod-binding protein [Candidatus Omnitrophota bacterium]
MISLHSILPSSGANYIQKGFALPGKEELFEKIGAQLKQAAEENLWWPPNGGILSSGEQKATHDELVSQVSSQEQPDLEEEAKLKDACTQFESFFLYYLLKEMDKTIPREQGLMGNSLTQKFYREMFYERLADTMSEGGMGLGTYLYDQLSQSLVNRIYK